MGSGIGKRADGKATTALERIERLEKGFQTLLTNQQGLLEGSNQAFSMTEDRIGALDMLAEAITDILGREKVQEAIKLRMETEATERMNKDKAAIENSVSKGNLTPGDGIGEKSVVTGRYIKKSDGKILHPGWQFFTVSQVVPELRSGLMGKKVGETVEAPIGIFEIQGVYEVTRVAGTQTDKDPSPEALSPPAALEEAFMQLPAATDAPEGTEQDADAALEEYMGQNDAKV
jgi:hypothetical protein